MRILLVVGILFAVGLIFYGIIEFLFNLHSKEPFWKSSKSCLEKFLMRYLVFSIIIFSGYLTGCSEREPDVFYKKLDFEIEKPSADTGGVFPPPPPMQSIVSMLEIVIPVEKDDLEFYIIIENLAGKLVYNEHYVNKFSSYPSFLQNLANGKFSIPVEYIDSLKFTMNIDTNYYGYVNLSDPINNEYADSGFVYILNKYFVEIGEVKKVYNYRLKNLDTIVTYTSLYKIMYDHQFVGSTDCYSGETSFFQFAEQRSHITSNSPL